jgi:hypothetical protein
METKGELANYDLCKWAQGIGGKTGYPLPYHDDLNAIFRDLVPVLRERFGNDLCIEFEFGTRVDPRMSCCIATHDALIMEVGYADTPALACLRAIYAAC